MQIKKIMAVTLAATMAAGLVGCGSDGSSASTGTKTSTASSATVSSATASGSTSASASGSGSSSSSGSTSLTYGQNDKIVVWTLTKDLEQFADHYKEKTGNEVETVVIEPADYPTKVQTALMGGESEPDIIVGEPQMLQDFYDNGFFEDLDQFGAQDYADQVTNYVWKVGQDADGIQRAISYQITPAGMYYRRDIATKVFGTDDPTEIGKLFADYPTILDTANKLKDAGYRIFASDAEMNYFSGDSAWVVDNKLNVDQSRYDYMDLAVKLYQDDLTAYASQWSTPWYQAMSGPIPILTADIQNGSDDSVNVWDSDNFDEATKDLPKTEVFAYGLPSWGVLTLRDNVKDTSGKWGVCSGPSYGFGGGTFIGISSQSKKKEAAWDFIKFCTLDPDTADWWIETSQGDVVALKSVLEKHKDDENPVYGNEKLYSFWLDQATHIDYSKVTKYDKVIGDAWGQAISSIKTGASDKETAINTFYDTVHSTYPDLEIDR